MCFQSFILCLRHFLKCAEERSRFNPWVRKIPWSRKWQPTPVFLPGEFHGQRSLLGYRQQGGKESDMKACTRKGGTIQLRKPEKYIYKSKCLQICQRSLLSNQRHFCFFSYLKLANKKLYLL